MVAIERGPDGGSAAARTRPNSVRRLRTVSMLAPTALVLVVAGPGVAGVEGMPIARQLAQPLFAGLGAVAALAAVYLADTCDDLPTIPQQNMRLLMLLMSLGAIAIGGAWLWLGTMNLVNWILGGGA